MSFQTGTQNEVLFSSVGASTNLATFTTEDNLQKTLAPCIIPAGFFYNNQAVGKSLRIKIAGQLGTTGAPTFTWTLRLLTSTTWSAAGIVLGVTAALTAGTTQTLAPWFLDAEVIMRNVNIGAASVVATMGEVRSPLGLASPFAGTIPANNVAPTVSTLDNSVTYYLFLSAACGTSNALNLINTQMVKVYGEN
ncbi:MAG: hypothetical protein DLM66_00135 [Candidatus Dormiibacter spiritus]|nr:MAG: hypothetical protein DLM66_00135 [Candidatus Dormibacteraeota bacterium]